MPETQNCADQLWGGVLLRRISTLVWLGILAVYKYRERGWHEITSPTSSKGTSSEEPELSFGKVSCLIAILTSTSYKDIEITDACYCTDVLLSHIRLFRAGMMGPQLLFLEDNATPYYTVAVAELLELGYSSHGLTKKVPEPNSYRTGMGHSREMLKSSHQSPAMISNLQFAVQEEWAEVSLQLVISIGKRCKCCSALRDYHSQT